MVNVQHYKGWAEIDTFIFRFVLVAEKVASALLYVAHSLQLCFKPIDRFEEVQGINSGDLSRGSTSNFGKFDCNTQ